MEKTLILRQQTTKLAEVLEVLRANFTEEELGEEISFLTIVKEKIEEEAARQAGVAAKADGPESEECYPLRSSEDTDLPFIEAIENS